jgi:hypothetical protein
MRDNTTLDGFVRGGGEVKVLYLAILPSSVTLIVLLVFRFVWTRPSQIRNALAKLALAALAMMWTLLALEWYFLCCVVASDGFGHTLSARKWAVQYWKPVNSFGYRDVEHDLTRLRDRKVLFVLGDSFVAGHGIKDHRDRMSEVLAAKLPKEWEIVNIAKCGWNTAQEFAALRHHPVVPNAVVLSYCINDIEGAAQRVWKQPLVRLIEPPDWRIRPLVDYSHLANFCYWRLWRFRNSNEMATTYHRYLKAAYDDERVWSEHAQEIRRIVDYAKNNEIHLVVVVFPTLADIAWSQTFTDKVVYLLRRDGIPVVDLSATLSGRNPHELVVNNMDAHASVRLNAEVAALLLPYLGAP